MPKGTGVIAKLNLRNIKAAYIWSGVLAFVSFTQMIIQYIIASSSGNIINNSTVSPGSYVFLLVLIAAIMIPASNFHRTINLGGRRSNFLWGSLVTYAILAVALSFINTISFFTFDQFIQQSGYFGFMGGVLSLVQVFGWAQNGFIIAFLQQAAFLFLMASFFHTFTAMQGKWYGWITNVVIVAILAVFIPVPVLRPSLVWFFNMIIFHDTAFLQIAACILLAAAIYALNKPIYARKAI